MDCDWLDRVVNACVRFEKYDWNQASDGPVRETLIGECEELNGLQYQRRNEVQKNNSNYIALVDGTNDIIMYG